MPRQRRTIEQVFSQVRLSHGIALMPFIPAGYPSLEVTTALLPALENAGAELIEIGIPFSDPIADGPVIQEAFAQALRQGVTVDQVFAAVAAIRPALSIPLVAMVSFSVVFRRGVERFAEQARTAGFDGVIIPDLPPPETERYAGAFRSAGLDMVLLVAPSTPVDRQQRIARLAGGFIYYLSVAGITGERQSLPVDLATHLTQLRQQTDKPICVGFGISKPEHVRQLLGLADGAIVGSGFVRRIAQNTNRTPTEIATDLADYCKTLRSGGQTSA